MVFESSIKQDCKVTHETLAKNVESYELAPSIFDHCVAGWRSVPA
jgi:hypothetical protein